MTSMNSHIPSPLSSFPHLGGGGGGGITGGGGCRGGQGGLKRPPTCPKLLGSSSIQLGLRSISILNQPHQVYSKGFNTGPPQVGRGSVPGFSPDKAPPWGWHVARSVAGPAPEGAGPLHAAVAAHRRPRFAAGRGPAMAHHGRDAQGDGPGSCPGPPRCGLVAASGSHFAARHPGRPRTCSVFVGCG